MARRASSGINPGLLIGVAIFVVIAVFGGKLFLGRKPDAISGAKINMEDVLDGVSLRDNEYVVEGTVDEKFYRDGNPNQVVSLKVSVPSGVEFLGVEIPTDLTTFNIEREQRYSIKVKFRQGGIPVATAINRL
jgi:hypothetical protein